MVAVQKFAEEARPYQAYQPGRPDTGSARLIMDHLDDRIEAMVQRSAIEAAVDFLLAPGEDSKVRCLCLSIMTSQALRSERMVRETNVIMDEIKKLKKDLDAANGTIMLKDKEIDNLRAALKNKKQSGEEVQVEERRPPKPDAVGSTPTPPALPT